MYGLPVIGGLQYRDSIELDELKHPMLVRSLRLISGTGGPGRFRGAPGCELVIGARRDPITVVIPCDMQENPPRGVRGGLAGAAAETWKIAADGTRTRLPNFVTVTLKPGEWLCGRDNGGGGYGDPLERDLDRLQHDVREGWITKEQAQAVYGAVFMSLSITIDKDLTERRRTQLRGAGPRAKQHAVSPAEMEMLS
jgi:N-methylhydantoinase B